MKTLGRGRPKFRKCQKHKGMTFRGEQVRIEKLLEKQKHFRNHPTYKNPPQWTLVSFRFASSDSR